jgi:hypothetical protein
MVHRIAYEGSPERLGPGGTGLRSAIVDEVIEGDENGSNDGKGGRWWSLVGRWWSVVVVGGRWWSLLVTGGRCWSLVVVGGRWWSLVVAGGRWWSLVVAGGVQLVVTAGHWRSWR